MAFSLESPAFHDGGPIPQQYARKGENLSPPLIWHDAPQGTESFALIVEDPDAPSGTFRHWGLYDITVNSARLPEGMDQGGQAAKFGHAVNDFGDAHYDGPQPPKGHGAHHYHFRLAALDIKHLDLPARASVADLWRAAKPHIIAEADLVGTFETR
jgi:Raf kinase inhibitor-like YbhB/YbcL family protein